MDNHLDGCLAIVVYRSTVGGEATKSLDFQVRWFSELDPEQVRQMIHAEPESQSEYYNAQGQVVRWELAEIFAVEKLSPFTSGEEIVGFIAQIHELTDLVRREP